MPRKPRVEYAGAVYHIMSRGDHREPIFRSDKDCVLFLKTLGEVCAQTGWVIHAWVLMGNHYHLLLETPKPNLVSGMKWFQGTYTQRFNSIHQEHGHLFQGRYKALLVDGDDPHYFRCVAAYIHLNPARANLIDLNGGGLVDYRWSSYPAYVRIRQRPFWMQADRLLATYQQQDDSRGRWYFSLQMKRRVLELKHQDEPWRADEEWDQIRRGWCFGPAEFKEGMLDRIGSVTQQGREKDSYNGEALRDYGQRDAERLVENGLKRLSLKVDELPFMKKGDPKKQVLAWLIKKHTRVSNKWIADRLHMGHPSNLPAYAKLVEESRGENMGKLKEKVLMTLK